jgi:hypothetical protein
MDVQEAIARVPKSSAGISKSSAGVSESSAGIPESSKRIAAPIYFMGVVTNGLLLSLIMIEQTMVSMDTGSCRVGRVLLLLLAHYISKLFFWVFCKSSG